MKRVVVVGGGIAGLSAAYRLSKLASGRYEVILLEASDRLGGKILTEQQDGCVFELGPDSFLTAKPQALELVHELGLDSKLVGTRPENSDIFVFTRGRLRRIPKGLSLMAPSKLLPFLRSDLFTWRGKLRMAFDWLLPAGGLEDESMAHFARRRLGKEALGTLVQPVMAGIYAGDAEQLSIKSTFPRFVEMERRYSSVIRGLRKSGAVKTAAKGVDLTMFMSLAGGLGELTRSLTNSLGSVVKLGTPVRSIMIRTNSKSPSPRRGEGRGEGESASQYRLILESGEELVCDAVIVTTPAWQTTKMLSTVDTELASTLEQIPFSSSATVSLLYDAGAVSNIPPSFGYVVAANEIQWISAATFSSMKFSGRAPAGTFLIRCFLGGVGKEHVLDRGDAEIIAGAAADLHRHLGIQATPIKTRLCRWPRANPQYTVGHELKLQKINARLKSYPGLLLAGASYRGVGIPDCIASGFQAAQEIQAYLSQPKIA